MEKHIPKINATMTIGFVLSLITLVTFASKTFGQMALDHEAIVTSTEFNKAQVVAHKDIDTTLARMDENIKTMMSYFKISPK